MASSSMRTERSPVATNRSQASEPTMWRCVSRIEPLVPGTLVASRWGMRLRHASINRTVAHTWCANASSSSDLLISAP